MVLKAQHTSVLIVGAGPSGLMMAAQLLRYGVRPIIIDSKQGPTDKSKALAVQARSLEIYRQMGIVDEVLTSGKPSKGLQFFYEGKKQGMFLLDDAGEGLTPYPYLFMYPQSKNEKDLLGFLTKNTLPVYWDTTITALSQDKEHVNATLTQNGKPITITADWIVGADGAHSFVRKSLNIPFKGDTYQHMFYLADIVSDKTEDKVSLYFAPRSFIAFFPTPDKNSYRIIGMLPPGLENHPDLKLEDILPDAERIKGSPIAVKKLNWFTTYKLSHRMAEKFSDKRCFLIGDAAHIHSPVGGQGMNTGLQDAYNLAWKLAGVVNSRFEKSIIDSYSEERMPVARQLLRTTDSVFNITMSKSWLAGIYKRFIMPRMLKLLWGSKGFTRAMFIRVSQIGISYRNSKINLHLGQGTKIKAGDRLPYLKIYDEKKKEDTDIQAWCNKPGFTMIIIGSMAEQELHRYAKWIAQTYAPTLNFFYLPYSVNNQAIFDALEIKSGHVKTLIVRPDNYIGFIADSTDAGIISSYLQNTMGLKRNATN